MYKSKCGMNPGSSEAVAKGCLCPVMDNRYGRGHHEDLKGNIVFVMNLECPIHGDKSASNGEKDGTEK